MRNTLERRLARLEARAGINTGLPRLIVISVVRPNGKFGGDSEPVRAQADGRVWHREAGETRKHFESRVEAEVLNLNHDRRLPTQIIFYPAEEGDAYFNPGTTSSGSDT
jgi:hypothetical protein